MQQIETARDYKGKNVRIYFSSLSDEDIVGLIEACEEELELRSQDSMKPKAKP